MTDLKGSYDFALDVTEEDYRAMLIRAGVNAGVSLAPAGAETARRRVPPSLFDAMQKAGAQAGRPQSAAGPGGHR